MSGTALVLSGGGAKGAFEVGAEFYLREVKGCRWSVVAGVSVGALNAAMLAQEKYDELKRCWETLCNEDIYTGELSAWTLLRIALGKDSIYGNKPLRRLIERNIEKSAFKIPCLVGCVDLVNGEYLTFSPDTSWFKEALLASTAIPVIWEPVNFLGGRWVDGGVRNICPIADVLRFNPDEVVIVNCSNRDPLPAPGPLNNAVHIGLRTLFIVMDEIFRNDVARFETLNSLAQQAEQQGAVLRHEDGRPYRALPYLLIEPRRDLGPSLEFNPTLNKMRYEEGWECARLACEER